MAALAPGSAGISTVDVIAVQKQVILIPPFLTGCRLAAADVNGDSSVTTVDVLAIQRFSIAAPGVTFNVGQYQFSPVSRSYPGVVSNQTGQNYDALVFGDVASSFVHRPESPSQSAAR